MCLRPVEGFRILRDPETGDLYYYDCNLEELNMLNIGEESNVDIDDLEEVGEWWNIKNGGLLEE